MAVTRANVYTLAVVCKILGVFITLCVIPWPVSVIFAVTRSELVKMSVSCSSIVVSENVVAQEMCRTKKVNVMCHTMYYLKASL